MYLDRFRPEPGIVSKSYIAPPKYGNLIDGDSFIPNCGRNTLKCTCFYLHISHGIYLDFVNHLTLVEIVPESGKAQPRKVTQSDNPSTVAIYPSASTFRLFPPKNGNSYRCVRLFANVISGHYPSMTSTLD